MDQSQTCAHCFISHCILEKHLAGKWLQQMLMWSKLSPLGYRHPTAVSLALVPLWGKCRDGSGDYVQVWCVPSASHVACIDQSHSNIQTWVFVTLFLESFESFCIYIAVWAGEFINGGVSALFVDNLYSELFVQVVTSTLLCPHNFVACLT